MFELVFSTNDGTSSLLSEGWWVVNLVAPSGWEGGCLMRHSLWKMVRGREGNLSTMCGWPGNDWIMNSYVRFSHDPIFFMIMTYNMDSQYKTHSVNKNDQGRHCKLCRYKFYFHPRYIVKHIHVWLAIFDSIVIILFHSCMIALEMITTGMSHSTSVRSHNPCNSLHLICRNRFIWVAVD